MEFIKSALSASQNRIRQDFPNAVHEIENINISENMVSMQIKSYASAESYNYKESNEATANRNDGRCINERHYSVERKLLITKDVDPTITDPFEIIKVAAYTYLAENIAGILQNNFNRMP